MTFNLATLSVREVREHAQLLRTGGWGHRGDRAVKGTAAWNVLTRDLIVPPPRQVIIDRPVGEPARSSVTHR
ncbi:hypothetical protein A5640_09600 [Mycobacterium asiaticum]|uniref:Uncharacterized protein n=1 Tax=Mycobacterium asiaticum TaxID=1790 RepID=A0A1A3KNL8_MYCAS|nr:hypothetical protein A5640_09600 [Mycobacterium asiaticum]